MPALVRVTAPSQDIPNRGSAPTVLARCRETCDSTLPVLDLGDEFGSIVLNSVAPLLDEVQRITETHQMIESTVIREPCRTDNSVGHIGCTSDATSAALRVLAQSE